MTADEIAYALNKQVPDMWRGVTLHTTYGELTLHGRDAERDAERVAALVRQLLEAQKRRLQRSATRLASKTTHPAARLERRLSDPTAEEA